MNLSLTRKLLCAGLLALGLACAALQQAAAAEISVKQEPGKVVVELGGQPFTEYIYEGRTKPCFYPVLGPGGVALTRNYPFKDNVEGEDKDHVHHISLWFCHGAVNGLDFWGEGTPKSGKIVQDKLEEAKAADGRAVIRTTDKWVAPDGKVVLTDARTMTLQELAGGARAIDFEIALKASEGDVTLGDTKEGSMGIRTVKALSIKGGAQAVNSEGVTGQDIWGKHAKWVDYTGKLDGKTLGVAIFDHPANPRHPTTWHAREYGLIAVNPFGLHDFEKAPAGAGDMVIKKGGEVTFRYRFLFHEGDTAGAKIEDAWKQYAAAGK